MMMLCKLVRFYRGIAQCLFGLSCTLMSVSAWADIPSAPGTGISTNDEIQQAMVIFKEGATSSNLAMYVTALFVYAGMLIASFIYAKKNKEWGQLGIVAIAGLVVIAIVLIVLNQIKSALN